jgi:trimethylamine--corrinoid protein Co-methyltransferase
MGPDPAASGENVGRGADGRRRKRPERGKPDGHAGHPQYRRLSNPFEPIRILSDDQIEALHRAALDVLQETGMRVLHEVARDIFRRAGASVDSATHMVRLEQALLEDALSRAPSGFELIAGSPERSVHIGGRSATFTTVGGPPNVFDTRTGKRPGTLGDYQDFMRLAQSFDVVHLINQCVEPLDVPLAERHLEVTHAQLTLTDKVPFVFSRGGPQVADCFAMFRIARGLSEEAFAETPCCYTVINTTSPLQLDIPMAQGIVDFATAGQPLVITPFTLSGAMAPVTILGALVEQHAEALVGLALAQLIRPGTPVVYGAFTSNVDMRSGAPAFGTPEAAKANFVSGQLARFLKLPWRSSNVNASNTPDAQAAYESQMSLWSTLLAGCNMVIHGAGWLEGGLSASKEKFVIDVEMLQMFAELFQPLAFSADELGLDAIRDVGPGGHFFATQHTMDRYRTAFYRPLVSDWSNFGQWTDNGAKDAATRAYEIAEATLAEFEPPLFDAARREELDAFRERRIREGGALPES